MSKENIVNYRFIGLIYISLSVLFLSFVDFGDLMKKSYFLCSISSFMFSIFVIFFPHTIVNRRIADYSIILCGIVVLSILLKWDLLYYSPSLLPELIIISLSLSIYIIKKQLLQEKDPFVVQNDNNFRLHLVFSSIILLILYIATNTVFYTDWKILIITSTILIFIILSTFFEKGGSIVLIVFFLLLPLCSVYIFLPEVDKELSINQNLFLLSLVILPLSISINIVKYLYTNKMFSKKNDKKTITYSTNPVGIVQNSDQYKLLNSEIERLQKEIDNNTIYDSIIELEKKLNEKQAELSKFEYKVIFLHKRFEHSEIDGERLPKIIVPFRESNFELARDSFEIDKIIEDIFILERKKRDTDDEFFYLNIQRPLKDLADELLLLAEFHMFFPDNEKLDSYEIICKAFDYSLYARRRVDVVRSYGYFLSERNETELAEILLEEVLQTYYPSQSSKDHISSVDQREVRGFLHRLVNVYKQKDKLEPNADNKKRIIKAYERLSRFGRIHKVNNPNLLNVANELNNLAVFYKNNKEYENSIIAYQSTIQAYEKCGIDPQIRYNISLCWSKLGNCYIENNQTYKAIDAYQTALTIRQELAKKDSLFSLAETRKSLSNPNK